MNNIVYGYSESTGEYLGKEIADIDVYTNEVLLPAHSTAIEPPSYEKNQIPVFTGNSWEIKTDIRGTAYYSQDAEEFRIVDIGQEIPEGYFINKPDIIPTIEELKSTSKSNIDREHSQLLVSLTGNASNAERDTWNPKIAAAEAFKNKVATHVQKLMLEGEAHTTGVDLDILITNIIEKNAKYHELIGLASGVRVNNRRLVDNSTEHEEVNSIMKNFQVEISNLKNKFDSN